MAGRVDEGWIRLTRDAVRGLGRALGADGALYDPDTGRPAPADHYAQTLTALALYYRPEAGDWRAPLEYWLAQPGDRLGHEPFNRLALLLLRRALADEGAAAEPGMALVEQGLRRCRTRRRYPANNWALLARVCTLSEAGGRLRHGRVRGRLVRDLDRWQTEAGGLIDFPRRPARARGGASTPVAYHCKLLLCLWLACRLAPGDGALEGHLSRALGWLRLAVTVEGGHLVGLGRSTHALYADACLLTVLRGVAQDSGWEAPIPALAQATDPASSAGLTVRSLFQGQVARLERQQRQDGLLSLNPAGGGREAGCWDPYMHLAVYNAWAAGLWAAAQGGHPWLCPGEDQGGAGGPAKAEEQLPCKGAVPHRGAGAPPESPQAPVDGVDRPAGRPPAISDPPSTGLLQDREVGLVRVADGPVTWVVSTRGQPVQGYSARRVDLRQAAAVPLHAEAGGRALLPAGCVLSAERLLASPWLAGWVPLVEHAGQLYAMLRLETAEVEATQGGVRIQGQGSPIAAHRPVGVGWPARALEAADWRWLGRSRAQRQSVRPPRLQGHVWRVEVRLAWPRIRHRLTLIGSPGSEARLLNPRGAAWLSGMARPDPGLRPVGGGLPSPTGAAQACCGAPISWPGFTLVIEHELELYPDGGARLLQRAAG